MKKPRQIYQEVKTIKHEDGNHFARVTVYSMDLGWPAGAFHLLLAESGPSDDWVDCELKKDFITLEGMSDAKAQRVGIGTFDRIVKGKEYEVLGL